MKGCLGEKENFRSARRATTRSRRQDFVQNRFRFCPKGTAGQDFSSSFIKEQKNSNAGPFVYADKSVRLQRWILGAAVKVFLLLFRRLK